MSRSRTLTLIIVVCGLAIGALAFVPDWLVHNRTLYGEGYRHLVLGLSAWKSRSVPVTTIGVLLAVGAGLLAAVRSLRPSLPAWPIQLATIVGLALLLASAFPIGQHGFASAVDLTPGWPLLVAIGLAVGSVAAGVLLARPTRLVAGALVIALLVLAPAAAAGRLLLLNVAEGTNQHYSDGTYTHIVNGAPGEVLTLREGSYSVGDTWSGRFEYLGLVIAFTDDPACPGSRGAYFAWPSGSSGDIRLEMIVDTCADGARAADLTGTWARD
jgi:hypothetical protein